MIFMSYIIHKDEKKKKITSVIKMEEPFIMKPKLQKRQNMLDIEEIQIVDKDIKEVICKKKFDRVFKRLTKISLEVMDDSSDEGDAIMALNEILKTKEILLDQYLHHLSKLEFKKMLKKLEFLEEQIKDYYVNLNYQNNLINEEEKGKSR